MTEEIVALLRKAKEGNNDACELLIEKNSGLIWSIVHRYCGRGVEVDDLYQLGCLGFLKAVQGFDEAFGTQFSTYAVPKISGEIRRFLRDDGAIKVGRTVKQQAALIATSREKLRCALGREPTLTELSEETDLTAEEIAAAELSSAVPESLEQENEDGLSLESVLGTEEPEAAMLRTIELRQAIDTLPEKERMIIALRYYRAFTQQECASVVHISQVQVSRLEKRALQKLRDFVSCG